MWDRLKVARLFGLRQAKIRIPPLFVLGAVMIIAVLGGLLLRSQLTAGGIAPSPAVSAPVASGTASSVVTQPDVTSAGSAVDQETPSASPQPTPGMTGYVWPLVDAKITLPFGPTADPALVTSGWVTTDEAVPDATGAETADDGVMPAVVSCERSSRPPSTATINTTPRMKTGGIRVLAWRRPKSQATWSRSRMLLTKRF